MTCDLDILHVGEKQRSRSWVKVQGHAMKQPQQHWLAKYACRACLLLTNAIKLRRKSALASEESFDYAVTRGSVHSVKVPQRYCAKCDLVSDGSSCLTGCAVNVPL